MILNYLILTTPSKKPLKTFQFLLRRIVKANQILSLWKLITQVWIASGKIKVMDKHIRSLASFFCVIGVRRMVNHHLEIQGQANNNAIIIDDVIEL